MSASINVRYTTTPMTMPESHGCKLKVQVLSATAMPKEIFVFQRNIVTGTDAEAVAQPDKFISLADPVDLEQYPVGAPDLEHNMPFYRLDNVELAFRDMVELDETKGLIDADVTNLVNTLNVTQEVAIQEDVAYPAI